MESLPSSLSHIDPTHPDFAGDHPDLSFSGSIPTDIVLVPPDAEEFLDPFADDDNLGLAAVETMGDDRPDRLELLNHLLRPFEDGTPCIGLVPSASAPEPARPFAEWIALHASAFRSHGTTAATWLAGRLDRLAATARSLRATCPDEFDAREEVMEAGLREVQRGIGWSECERSHAGEMLF
jgi:hypothetical protein